MTDIEYSELRFKSSKKFGKSFLSKVSNYNAIEPIEHCDNHTVSYLKTTFEKRETKEPTNIMLSLLGTHNNRTTRVDHLLV